MDPAYPGFSVANTADRLDTTDARFVDVMHTNSETIPGGGLSFPVAIGHVDFWPNGGVAQPVGFHATFSADSLIHLAPFFSRVALCPDPI